VAPTATINAPVPNPAVAGSPVAFSATVAGGQGPFTYAWAFSGGTPPTSASATPTTTFTSLLPHTVTLTVTDALGRSDAAPARIVTVVAPPPPTVAVSIVTPPTGPYTAPISVTFRATPSGGLGPYDYSWPALPLLSGAVYLTPTNTEQVTIQFTQAFNGSIRVNIADDLGQLATGTVAIVVAAPPPPPPPTTAGSPPPAPG
jgi:PKD repeat protein